MTIKRIMRYLKGTKDYGLWYKIKGNLDLKVFTDADWARNIETFGLEDSKPVNTPMIT